MTSSEDEIYGASQQKTFLKQQLHLLKREQCANLETSTADTISDPDCDSNKDLPDLHPSSPVVASVVAPDESNVVQALTEESAEGEVEASDSPLTDVPKTPLKSSEDKAAMENYDQDMITTMMASLVVASPLRKLTTPASPTTSPRKHKKYYVVSAGKRTGVFDSWPYVQSLISGVSGNCQKSYATYDEALDVYHDLKAQGLVKIIRDRGDDSFFGPVENAVE